MQAVNFIKSSGMTQLVLIWFVMSVPLYGRMCCCFFLHGKKPILYAKDGSRNFLPNLSTYLPIYTLHYHFSKEHKPNMTLVKRIKMHWPKEHFSWEVFMWQQSVLGQSSAVPGYSPWLLNRRQEGSYGRDFLEQELNQFSLAECHPHQT